jgi:hypothetical protein
MTEVLNEPNKLNFIYKECYASILKYCLTSISQLLLFMIRVLKIGIFIGSHKKVSFLNSRVK